MGYYGKDGQEYSSYDKMQGANNRWEQQQKQNELLKKQERQQKEQNELQKNQNKLLKQQNDLIIQQQMKAEREKFQEKMNQIEKEQNEQLQERINRMEEENKELVEVYTNKILEYIENVIFPEMEKAGVKNPKLYAEKLQQIYGDEPDEKEIKLLDEENFKIIEDEEMSEYPNEMWKTIKKINMFTIYSNNDNDINSNKIIAILCLISMIGFVILGIVVGFLSFLTIVIGFLCCFITYFLSNQLIKFHNKKNKDRLEKRKKLIKSLNIQIDKLNDTNDIKEWKNKIKKLEIKRLENFNYVLEFNIEFLGESYRHIEDFARISYRLEKEENSKFDFRLRYNSYPSDYEKKKEEYIKQQAELAKEKKRLKAIEDGTEIFEDL